MNSCNVIYDFNMAGDGVWIQRLERGCRVTSLLAYFNGFARKRAPEVEHLGTVKRLTKPLSPEEFGLAQREVWPLSSASGR